MGGVDEEQVKNCHCRAHSEDESKHRKDSLGFKRSDRTISTLDGHRQTAVHTFRLTLAQPAIVRIGMMALKNSPIASLVCGFRRSRFIWLWHYSSARWSVL
jgi:hypothetical protein